MPRAFLMQYRKKQVLGDFPKDKKTRQDIAISSSATIHHNHLIKEISGTYDHQRGDTMEMLNKDLHHGLYNDINDDEEISVTDDDDDDEEQIHVGYNQYHRDDVSEEEEEINIDDSDVDDDVFHQGQFSNHNTRISDISDSSHLRNHLHENTDGENIADVRSNIIKGVICDTVDSDKHCCVNSMGSKDSAFTKPLQVQGQSSDNSNKHRVTSSDKDDKSAKDDKPAKVFSGVNLDFSSRSFPPDHHAPVNHYWMQMAKMYHGGIPPNLHALHMDTGLNQHAELLQRQMLHNQMLYYNNIMTSHHPHAMHRVVQQSAMSPTNKSFPVNGAKVKSENNIERTDTKTSGNISSKQTFNNTSGHIRGDNNMLLNLQHPRHHAFGGLITQSRRAENRIPDITPPVLSPLPPNLHLPFPPTVITHTSLPSPVSPMSSPSQLTPPLTSPLSPNSVFGSPMPIFYNSVFGYGARRPRDPNKPPPVKKYKCDICGKAFSRSNTLVTHRRIHTGEKPFKCEVCSRAFRQPGNLTRHRLTHTTVKPYVCVVCKKAFNRASNLHTHMRTHTNFRPFLCPYCGKAFQQKVDLKIHMYTHGSGGQ